MSSVLPPVPSCMLLLRAVPNSECKRWCLFLLSPDPHSIHVQALLVLFPGTDTAFITVYATSDCMTRKGIIFPCLQFHCFFPCLVHLTSARVIFLNPKFNHVTSLLKTCVELLLALRLNPNFLSMSWSIWVLFTLSSLIIDLAALPLALLSVFYFSDISALYYL